MIKKFLNILKKEGLRGILNRIKTKVYQTYYLYEIDLTSIELDNKIFLVELNNNLLEKLKFESNGEISDEKISILKKKLNFTEIKDYIFLENELMVGHYGLAFENKKENPYINNNLKINWETSYLFDDYTLKRFRGKGYHKRSILDRLAISKEKECKKSTVLIYVDNIFSQKSYERIGFKRKRKLYEVKILKNKIIYGVKYGYKDM